MSFYNLNKSCTNYYCCNGGISNSSKCKKCIYDNRPNTYLYRNYNTDIILEEQDDYNRSLKVKEIKYGLHRELNYGENCGDIYEKTKYLQYSENNDSIYVHPVPIGPTVECFKVGQTIPITMINDGLIFNDINDAVDYAKQKHEQLLKKEIIKREQKRNEKEKMLIAQRNVQNYICNLVLQFSIALICLIYFAIVIFPWMLICICVNTYKSGFRCAINMIIWNIKDIICHIKKYANSNYKT